MEKRRKLSIMSVLFFILAVLLTGCQDDAKETAPSTEVSTEDRTDEYVENSTDEPFGEQETLAEEELIQKEQQEKEERIKAVWKLLLMEVFGDYAGSEQYHISAYFDDPIDSVTNAVLYDNWSILRSGQIIRDSAGEVYLSLNASETRDYSVKKEAKTAEDSAYLMEGSISKRWNDEYQKVLNNAFQEANIACMNQSIMGVVGELYEMKTGSVHGTVDATVYLVDGSFRADSPQGSLWICFAHEAPIHVRVYCHRESKDGVNEFTYNYTIDQEEVFSEAIVENAMLEVSIDLTFQAPEIDEQLIVIDLPARETEELPEENVDADLYGNGSLDLGADFEGEGSLSESEDILLWLSRINDTELQIIPVETGDSEILTVDAKLLDECWPVEIGDSITTYARKANMRLGKDAETGEYRIDVSYRVGTAELTGTVTVDNNKKAVVGHNIRIAERTNKEPAIAEAEQDAMRFQEELWLEVLGSAVVQVKEELRKLTTGYQGFTYQNTVCIPLMLRGETDEQVVSVFLEDKAVHQRITKFEGMITDSGDALEWEQTTEEVRSTSYGLEKEWANLVIETNTQVEWVGTPIDPEGDQFSEQCDAAELLLHAALRYAGEKHLAQSVSMEDTLNVYIYLTKSTYDLDDLSGELLVQIGENAIPTQIKIVYDGSCRQQVADYTVTVEESLQSFYEVKDAIYFQTVINTACNEKWSFVDYDGDGLMDEIYEVSGVETSLEYGLSLGNGETFLFEKGENRFWSGSVHQADVTGDMIPEVIYLCTEADGGFRGDRYCRIQIFERTENGLQPMAYRDCFGKESSDLVQIDLSVVLVRLGENRIRITQPECGMSIAFEVDADLLAQLGYAEDEYKTVMTTIRSIARMEQSANPKTGQATLIYHTILSGSEHSIYLVWEMSVEEGVWRVTNLYSPG